MSRNNKILIFLAIAALLVIGLILGAVYFFAKGGDGGLVGENGDAIDFSPFGQGGNGPNQTGTTGSTTPTLPVTANATPIPLLRKLSTVPVAAYMTGNTTQGTDGALIAYARFMERATGHVFEIPLSLMTPSIKISNTTIPRIQEGKWAPNGKDLYVRYYDEKMERVATYLAKLVFTNPTLENQLHLEEVSSASTTLQGIFLETDITDLAFSPNGGSLFYLLRTASGARGYVRNIEKKSNKLVFSSPLNELRPTWDSAGTILLSTKPASSILGYVFSLNLNSGYVDTLLTDVPSVLARSNAAYDRVIYFSTKNKVPLLNLLNMQTKEVRGMELSTLPEKCVWSKREQMTLYCAVPAQIPAGAYPDVWYRGEVTYSDIIWKINLETRKQDIVIIPGEVVGEGIDAVDLALSPEEDFLLFIDKDNGILWSAKLREPSIKAPKQQPVASSTSATP